MALIAMDRKCELNGSVTSCNRLGIWKEGVRNEEACSRNNKMQAPEVQFSMDGLPRAFLISLRTLFDILDDGKKGYVHISEIESRWQGTDTQDLPGSVLECLRRVVPPHGCLTFERFVAGLRYSMLNPDNSHANHQPGSRRQLHPNSQSSRIKHGPPQHTPPQTHILDSAAASHVIENKVRPLGPSNGANSHHNRIVTTGHPTSSKPRESSLCSTSSTAVAGGLFRYNGGCERTGRSLERISIVPNSGLNGTDSTTAGKHRQQRTRPRSIESIALESSKLKKTSGEEHTGLPRSQSVTTTGLAGVRRHGQSRDEQRRHTITNGVHYETLKQMKELEQEKDTLLAGLEVVERAREWYQNQIYSVTERQRQVGQSSHCTDFFAVPTQSRLNLLLPKLQEVNHCLSDLLSCSGMPFTSPGGLSLSVSTNPQPPPSAPPQAILRLKDQNRLLTQEVTEKSQRITQLEQEKSALIKQLFDARARSAHEGSALDSTFI
ncbi:suppressor APC domain-containing protein 2-like [Megalops cyprinoides]|uniref:suppressor APC domain-containing protein 2-like n=1 Tax=Megalops cyprinoides TaxID=118141 RepID=UPI0018642B7E|nr:suppressor APC domain-containing protein 2-like [Megalops cyprinoides]